MCGIAAIFSNSSEGTTLNFESKLLHMLGAIRHRGDGYNFAERKILPNGAMGTNRLAIVDRDQGSQPVTDASSGKSIIMNGEIYNHHDLHSN